MKVRVVCKYCKSEKNATVISSERHSNDSGQGGIDVWIDYKVRMLPHQFGRKSCTGSGKNTIFYGVVMKFFSKGVFELI